jgi:hypothetical protein
MLGSLHKTKAGQGGPERSREQAMVKPGPNDPPQNSGACHFKLPFFRRYLARKKPFMMKNAVIIAKLTSKTDVIFVKTFAKGLRYNTRYDFL